MTEIEDEGHRFENMMAVHLMKTLSYANDLGEVSFSLHYLRDREKREVDFLLCEKRKPFIAVECKYSDHAPSSHLAYFAASLETQRVIQVVAKLEEPNIVDPKNWTA
jgi:predicted AAA+ superfamily ATPase